MDPGKSLRAEALDTARQFEQIFIQQMLEGMRKSANIAGGDGLFGGGPGNDTYSQWFDNHLAEHLSRHGKMGIAETLMKEFERWHQIPPATSVETEGSEESFDYQGGLYVTA
jgi:Rod binding domain-containing protein